MGKVKSFAAKLAHEATSEGKVMCPVCNTEIKRIKLITNQKTDGTWRPNKQFVQICKCNEADIMAGKNI
ncbi:MAG: hypothetical protein PHU99_00800 [Candidatus Cloacimonetes bacterium]|jgi:hypothetical protein|nr:hypothetical protein [Candidatus Cloacimonadota bacterium]MDY0337064.1 hypothetical protein [Candidatus Cloacimonadaceae bacterium]MCK9336069.1 hypothetical protein [Candidatus Cloacimonadota bacterium]MDD2544468.1 hypothetical protein [Candidatus Cloacimonadota bacterium]MDD2684145.1 hypothetical protein [Candidatus Cloacimonadota bacterium]